ncbi:hypothetical protein [Arvimicrobium flavum]|uniref:hypothetical protein n=1 Tax=Arvimicrobium flavum TaxID=3393320 RepID=UPI00237B44E7|nr:hypothetical protein [Mesorhizobium shangrilense]
MFFGVSTLQTFHVLVSLVGIVSGLVVLYGLLTSQRMSTLTAIFLATTLVTTLTGFLFPITVFTPALGVGVISTLVMIVALLARYPRRMRGPWRAIYVVTAVLSLYLNVFVLVVQLFLKVPALNALAPNGSEPPLAVAQGLVLLFFVVTGYLAVRRFHPVGAFGRAAAQGNP